MGHSIFSIEDYEENRWVMATDTLTYLYISFFLEEFRIQKKDLDNAFLSKLKKKYEIEISPEEHPAFINLKLDDIYNNHKEVIELYLKITDQIIISLNKNNVIPDFHFDRIPVSFGEIDHKHLIDSLKDLINDIKWVFRVKGVKPSNRFKIYYENYSSSNGSGMSSNSLR